MTNGKAKYRIEMTKSAYRIYKKFDPKLQEKIKEEAKKIGKDPYKREKLTNLPVELRSHHFSFQGSAYRIAYEVNEDKNIVYIKLVHTTENFYEKLKRVLGLC